MTASEHLSIGVRLRLQIPLHTFALNCCLPETLSKVVLGAVSSAMASVTDNWNDNFPVFSIVGKNAFESIAEVVEVTTFWNLGLKEPRFDWHGGLSSDVKALCCAASFHRVEESSGVLFGRADFEAFWSILSHGRPGLTILRCWHLYSSGEQLPSSIKVKVGNFTANFTYLRLAWVSFT